MLNRRVLFLIIYIYNHCCSANNAFSSEQSFPGLIESLEKISTINDGRLEKKFQFLAKNIGIEKGKQQATQDLFLEPAYFQSLVMNSDMGYLQQSLKNECQLYAFLENGLLKTSNKLSITKSNYILAQKFDGIKLTPELITNEDFFKLLYSLKCFQNKEIAQLFSNSFYAKTINNLKFNIPKNQQECLSIQKEWKENDYLPYLCKIPEVLRNHEKLKENKSTLNSSDVIIKQTSLLQRNYLEALCFNLNSPDIFCNKYLGKEAWNRITNGEIPASKLTTLCQNFRNKKTVDLADLSICANHFVENPKTCTSLISKNFPALFPRPDCDEISDALGVSQLSYNYADCPGMIDNETVTTIHRIINHYRPRDYLTTPNNCHTEAITTFANLNFEFKNKQAWPLEICYKDRIENDEVCKTYIPGGDPNNKLSETIVLSKILNKQYNTSDKMVCSLVEEEKYNPAFLEYKNGCFVLFKKKQCTSFKCDKNIILNGREITDIKYKGIPLFDTIPNSFRNENFAIMNMVSDYLKISMSPIKNLTELKFFLTQAPGRIIMGIGCSEDILPQYFRKNALNQCTPLPIIIDGVREIHENSFLSIRTALDGVNSPRFINWNLIYNGVSSFKELHPLGTWALYGLK